MGLEGIWGCETADEDIRIRMEMKGTPIRTMDARSIDSITLASLCAHNPQDTELWSEFLRRFSPRIKSFIQAALKQYGGWANNLNDCLDSGQGSSDIFQNTVLRLVQNQCAALKRFSGTTETDLIAYLVVIARSAVRDSIRRKSAKRRFHWFAEFPSARSPRHEKAGFADACVIEDPIDRRVLAAEVEQLSLETIRAESDEPERDALIFQLYFMDGLSIAQIASCKGIGLSKTGVEKMLNRLKEKVRNRADIYAVGARS